jgi:rhamnosyltransferase subunit B
VARIVLNTFGSFGDLHPYLAIALRLRASGHEPVLATSAVYRAKVQEEGIAFHPVRPDVRDLMDNTGLLQKLWDERRGTEYLLRDFLLPAVKDGYEDLAQTCAGADLLLTHTAAYAGPVVAEKLKLRWISVALQPAVFMSRYDPPLLAPVLWLRHLGRLRSFPFRVVFAAGKRITRSWAEPVFRLRRELGLQQGENPIFEGQFSPFGTLAMFSPEFARPQPDWPPRVRVAGFAFYDQPGAVPGLLLQDTERLRALDRFLESGEPPLLFTLGSSAVMQAGNFFRESIRAAQMLGRRAVLLTGAAEPPKLAESIFVASYLPYSQIMPRALAIIHQGGIGTTAQALRAGRPMLVVPWAHDQPDNAERLRKLGVARVLPRRRYRAGRVAWELKRLLANENYSRRARQIAATVANEDGAAVACEVIESVLRLPRPDMAIRQDG